MLVFDILHMESHVFLDVKSFICFSAVNSDQQTAPRTGFFHSFKQKEVLVKEWDARMEGRLWLLWEF